MVNPDTMIEAPERTGISGIKKAVGLRRFIKELAHAEDIDLRGVRGQRLGSILDKADQALSELQEEHADWIEQKRELLASYLSLVKPPVVEEAYRAGLATTITQEFRTYDRVSKGEVVKLDDPRYLRGVITGYTVDFFHSLRLSERLGINPNTALEVARLSYRYNPTRLVLLIRDAEFTDLTKSSIEYAALHNPKDPEAFLRGFIASAAADARLL